MSSTAGCGLGATVAFTGLGGIFAVSVPAVFVFTAAGFPEGEAAPVPGEEAGFSAVPVPLSAAAVASGTLGLVSDAGVLGTTEAAPVGAGPGLAVPPGAMPLSVVSGFCGTPGNRSARISTARAAHVWSGCACR